MSGDFDQSALIEAAYQQARRDVVDRRPALSLLSAEAHLWRLLKERVREGYELGITDVPTLSARAKAALPQTRKFRRD